MLKQVAVPRDQDANGWERLFAYYVSQEMERSGATPAQAASQAATRLRQAFGAQFPGDDLPIEIEAPVQSADEEPLPGGLRTADGRYWFLLARVEDDRSLFPESERITAELLATMTAAYDADFRRAAMIQPNGGPAHQTGEWSRFIPANVEALEFDGYYLWGLVAERFEGGLEWLVEDGHTQRSISWWPSLPELDGEPPYLRHVALLTGEPPGIANMPGLEQWFLADQGMPAEELREVAALPTCSRSLDRLPSVERSLTMPEKKNNPANQDGTPDTRNEPSIDLDELVERVAAKLASANEPKEPKNEPDNTTALRDAVAAAVKPLADELAEFRAEAKNTAAERRKARITERLDQFVRDGKLSPADRDTYGRLLAPLSEEDAEKELEALGKRSKIALLGNRTETVTIDDAEVRIPAHLRPAPGEAPLDPTTMRALMKAREAGASESDPTAAYQAKRRAIYAAFGEELTN